MNPIMHSTDLAVFGLGASRGFAERVCGELGLRLSPHEDREFEDGEHKVRPLLSVRGKDVFVIHSLYGDAQQSVNDKLCRLLFFVGALRDASADRITAVVPYLCYARADRRSKSRDAVTTRYVAAMFEAAGVNRVVAMDVHNVAAFQNAFRICTEHLEARSLFVDYFSRLLDGEALVVVSPDAGGVKRASDFREALARATGRPIGGALMEKSRSGDTVTGETLLGEVAGKTAIVLDDLISTGTTLARTAAACRKQGATRVYAAASHAVFSRVTGAILTPAGFENLVVTDTIPPFRLKAEAAAANLVVLDATKLFAEAIQRLHTNASIVELLER